MLAMRRHAGFTLVELMISLTLGMLILIGLTSAFVNSSRTRDELERSSQQIENGRYAAQVLTDELRLAGYWAELDLGAAAPVNPASKPDACASDAASLAAALPLHIQGYDAPAASPTCLTDVKAGTDIVVVRRASTCVRDTSAGSNCADVPGAQYFQASLCNSSTELGSPTTSNQFRIDSVIASLDRHKKDCTTLADVRQFVTRIYFIANNDATGDGIPTLKRAELGAGGFSIVSVASGIENLQLEYGIDTNADGVPDALNANPDSYGGCAGGSAACVVTNWANVMTVKINLLARNTSASVNWSDGKTYALGLNADGTANTIAPSNTPYKRHVFQSEVRLTNAAGRRE
jgi:type IV pilus assembly protein PilW